MTIQMMIPLGFMLALSGLMAWVVVSDAVRYTIPNSLNLTILVLFVLGLFFFPIEPFSALGAAVLVLLVGLALFALGLMGGGDVKLLVVLTLWTGWHMATANFLFLTAIAGGLLVFIVLPIRLIFGPIWLKRFPTRNLPRLLTRREPVPYGIAIAAAFLWMLWMRNIPALA